MDIAPALRLSLSAAMLVYAQAERCWMFLAQAVLVQGLVLLIPQIQELNVNVEAPLHLLVPPVYVPAPMWSALTVSVVSLHV